MSTATTGDHSHVDNDVDRDEMNEVCEEHDDGDDEEEEEEEESGTHESEDALENDINDSKSDNDYDGNNDVTGVYSEQFSEDGNEIDRIEKEDIGDDNIEDHRCASKDSENPEGFEKYFDDNESNGDDQASNYVECEESGEDEGTEGDNEVEIEGADGDGALGETLATYLGLLRSADKDAQNILRDNGTKFIKNLSARDDYLLEDNGFSPVKISGERAIAGDFYGSGMNYDDMVSDNYISDDDTKGCTFETNDSLIVNYL
jgi:hypothetical protein